MTNLQTILIAAITASFMTTFAEVAKFFVNRYLPKVTEHLEKKIKKPR